jgi:NAD(P)-dependent dehydrogenase (short-subunit alcohol dehydrogenase family)
MPPTTARTWLITGTSQGFGLSLVRAALARGDRVVATSRDPDKVTAAFPDAGNRLYATPMDLRDPASIQGVVDSAIGRFGQIDVLVNNAGHGMLGAVEEVSETEIQNVFEINVFGLLRVTRAVLPDMRRRRSGGFTTRRSSPWKVFPKPSPWNWPRWELPSPSSSPVPSAPISSADPSP